MRHRVTLQSYTTTQDAYGTPIQTWSDVGTYWAAVEPVSGKERFASGQRIAESDVRIIMRYIGTILPAYRISFDSKLYDIKAIINRDERNREYELICTEGASDG